MTRYEWIKVSWNKNYAPHYLPCCPHIDNTNTLLLLGVPSYLTNDNIKEYFETFGNVVNVSSQRKPSVIPKCHIPNNSKFFRDSFQESTFRCCFIQYLEADGLTNLMNKAKLGLTFYISDLKPTIIGSKKWSNLYKLRYPDEEELRSACEDYMTEFDEREKLKLLREKEMAEAPDEDGWITVTRNAKGASKESGEERYQEYSKKMERKKKEMLHLYSFQEREKQRESLVVLKRKFQEDKEKIAKMKSARKFKPY